MEPVIDDLLHFTIPVFSYFAKICYDGSRIKLSIVGMVVVMVHLVYTLLRHKIFRPFVVFYFVIRVLKSKVKRKVNFNF